MPLHGPLSALAALALLGWPVLSGATPDGGRPAGRAGAPAAPRDNVVKIRRVARSPQLKDGPAVEIEVTSPRAFPVMGLLPVMRIGRREVLTSRYRPDGDLHTLIFTLTPEEFDATKAGDAIVVQYGRGAGEDAPPPRADLVWSFGPLRKPQ